MNRRSGTFLITLTAVLCLMAGSLTGAKAQSSNNKANSEVWYALIPPGGVETNLPAYDKWEIVMKNPEKPEAMRLNTEATKNAVMQSYFRNSGIQSDGKAITKFQLEHMIFYNLTTRAVVKAPWGWTK